MTQARILVVQDDPGVTRRLHRALEAMGHRVLGVEEKTQDGVERAVRRGADLVLLAGSAHAALDDAQRIARRLRIPVLHLPEGSGDAIPSNGAAPAGTIDPGTPGTRSTPGAPAHPSPCGYLVKPFEGHELQAAIELGTAHCRPGSGLELAQAPFDEILEKYETIFRTSPIAIALTSLAGEHISEVNEAFVELSGWTRSELLGRNLSELGWWARPRERARMTRAAREEGMVRGMEVLLRTRDGASLDALVSAELLHLRGRDDLLLLFHDITERKRLERELEHLALHDPLTGLPNRTLFFDRLNHALGRVQREGGALAVLFLDLDRFKMVNDSMGHPRGDDLLRAVADRIHGCCREQDTMARFGGDEFAGILELVEGEDEVRTIVGRFQRALDPPFDIAGTRIRISASVGAAVGWPSRKTSPEELVRRADIAMYCAKRVTGTSFELYDPERCAEEDVLEHGLPERTPREAAEPPQAP